MLIQIINEQIQQCLQKNGMMLQIWQKNQQYVFQLILNCNRGIRINVLVDYDGIILQVIVKHLLVDIV